MSDDGLLPDDDSADEAIHPAVAYFVRRFEELMRTFLLPPTSRRGKPRRTTPGGVLGLLRDQAQGEAPTQTQHYRLARGDRPATVVDVEKLASLFGVSPRSFLREQAPRSDAHERLLPSESLAERSFGAGAPLGRDRLRQVDQLVPGMKDRWLVASQSSFHLWDLDAMTYARIPGPASQSGSFGLDLRVLAITRVDAWPRVGSTSLVWFDDPGDPGGTEQWRQSSRIISITEVPGNG